MAKMVTNAELRARARQSLTGQWGRSAFFMLIVFVVVTIAQRLPYLGELLNFVTSGAVAFGIYGYYLRVARGERPPFMALTDGFPQLWLTFKLYFFMTLFTLLWMLLFIVPGIIAAIRYSQAYYIAKDNPEIGALEAIRRSKAMMDGHKGRLFVLALSFIGWLLLGALAVGIGLLWVYPYMMTTFAHFHEDLRTQSSGFDGYDAARPLNPPPHPQSF
jgi:uncharacterized membrane protein